MGATFLGSAFRPLHSRRIDRICPGLSSSSSPIRLGPSAAPVGNDGHLKILCEADDGLGEIPAT
jgi:hypothetical protein